MKLTTPEELTIIVESMFSDYIESNMDKIHSAFEIVKKNSTIYMGDYNIYIIDYENIEKMRIEIRNEAENINKTCMITRTKENNEIIEIWGNSMIYQKGSIILDFETLKTIFSIIELINNYDIIKITEIRNDLEHAKFNVRIHNQNYTLTIEEITKLLEI